MENLVSQQKGKFTNNFVFVAFLVLIGVIGIFFFGGRMINFVNALCIFLFVYTMAYMQYSQILPTGLAINKTAIELEIGIDCIIAKTSPFKFLFFINKAQKKIKIRIDELNVGHISYPVKNIDDIKSQVVRLADGSNEVYVIIDFFAGDLKETLMNLNHR